MKVSLKLKALAAAVALLVGGQAFAQTGLNTSSTGGTLFLIVWDSTAATDYVVNLASTSLGSSFTVTGFTDPSGPLNVDLSTDANWTAFVASVQGGNLASTSDSITYSVLGAVNVHNGWKLDLTTTSATPIPTQTQLSQLLTNLGSNYINPLNGVAASGTAGALSYSQFITSANNSSAYYGNADVLFGTVTPSEVASLGTAMNFYKLIANAVGNGASGVTAYTGTWDLTNAGLLTYGSAASVVPLPKSWILLLSGLLLMVVIARRGKSAKAEDGMFPGTAA